MVRLIVTCLLFLLATAPIGPGAHATTAASDWAGDDNVQVRLISGVSAVGKDGALPIGLQFRLAEGWKVYWRSAGDAGFPPSIVWDGSRNFGAATGHGHSRSASASSGSRLLATRMRLSIRSKSHLSDPAMVSIFGPRPMLWFALISAYRWKPTCN